MTNREILGIHHITAIASDPQANLDFYAGVLGLRLVKLTVNYDDPGTYHLYYGDGVGHPGTILTFFPWPNAPRGRRGTGLVSETAFAVPENSLEFWTERLTSRGVAVEGPVERFGEKLISFADPDGMRVELVASATAPPDRAWEGGSVPASSAIRGFHSATLQEADEAKTAELLTGTMGFRKEAQDGNRSRYIVESGSAANVVDVLHTPGDRPGRVLAGTVHHIAWRTPDDGQQTAWLAELTRRGHGVSPVMDRKYFHSIYFREPGHILFEIATDPPGFGVDEAPQGLGSGLVLPPWLEPERARLEAVLPPLRIPAPVEAARS